MSRGSGGWFELEPPPRARAALYRYRVDGGISRCPTRHRAFSPGMSTAPAWWSIPVALTGRIRTGEGLSWEQAVVYELHVGTFTAEGSFRAAESPARLPGGVGNHGLELMPLRIFRAAQLGIRWRAALCARQLLRYSRRSEAADSSRPRARADGISRCGVQPLSAPRAIICAPMLPISSAPGTTLPGETRSTSTGLRAARCAISSSTTPCTGWRNITSTGCGSMPCTPSSTIRNPTS
jgi:hypothetical protein